MNIMEQDRRGAGVKVPPPLIFITAILLGVFLNAYLIAVPITPEFMSIASIFIVLGVAFVVIAFVLVFSALYQLRKAKTSIEPWKPTSHIVSNGIFGISRNPIYLAFICIDIGCALLLNNLWVLLTLAPAIWGIKVWVIEKEEHYLQQKFAEQYSEYCASVRRWL